MLVLGFGRHRVVSSRSWPRSSTSLARPVNPNQEVVA
jgi:hypothetical protein